MNVLNFSLLFHWFEYGFFLRKNLQNFSAGVNVYADIGVKLALII